MTLSLQSIVDDTTHEWSKWHQAGVDENHIEHLLWYLSSIADQLCG